MGGIPIQAPEHIPEGR